MPQNRRQNDHFGCILKNDHLNTDFSKTFLISASFCHRLITFANNLDPDLDQQNVGPDLDQNS